MQINKTTPRFFYTHPDLHPLLFPNQKYHTHTHTHTEYLGSASPVAWQQLMGKKAGCAPMIKISWVAVFDPQYAVIVSPQLHKKPNTGVAGEGREYINFLTLVKRWLALLTDFSSNFFKDKEAPASPDSSELGTFFTFPPPPVIPVTLTIHWSVPYFKESLKRRGNTSMEVIAWVRHRKRWPFLTVPRSVYLKCCCQGGEGSGDIASEGMCS